MSSNRTLKATRCATIIAAAFAGELAFGAEALAAGPTQSVADAQAELLDWAHRYDPASSDPASPDALVDLVTGALREMYLEAQVNQIDEQSLNFYDVVMANKDVPTWDLCGWSSAFVVIALDKFDVPARFVESWRGPGDGHMTLEYWSADLGKFVWYDPLYGVRMIDAAGEVAGVADLENEITSHGFDATQWRYKPVRAYGRARATAVVAADPLYQEFNSLDYNLVLKNYFNVAVVRYEDSWITGQPLPGETVAMGKRLVYDNTVRAQLDPTAGTALLQYVIDQSSIRRNGVNYLTVVQLKDEDSYFAPAPVGSVDASDSCPGQLETISLGGTLDIGGATAPASTAGHSNKFDNYECGWGLAGAAPDRVYRVTPGASGTLNVELRNVGEDGGFDGMLSAWKGSCTDVPDETKPSFIGCQDEAYGKVPWSVDHSQKEQLKFPVVAGTSYFIVVDGWSDDSYGAFWLHLELT